MNIKKTDQKLIQYLYHTTYSLYLISTPLTNQFHKSMPKDPTQSSDTICNNPRKSTSYIYVVPQKDQSQLRLLAVVNKSQIYLVNTRCETYHTPTHITQSIKLGHHRCGQCFSLSRYIWYQSRLGNPMWAQRQYPTKQALTGTLGI